MIPRLQSTSVWKLFPLQTLGKDQHIRGSCIEMSHPYSCLSLGQEGGHRLSKQRKLLMINNRHKFNRWISDGTIRY